MDITSIHNWYERAVFNEVMAQAEAFPHLKGNDDVLADIACVALNRLPPRYIRHDVDLAFFQTERERNDNERAVVEAALGCLARGEAFTASGKLSAALRRTVAAERAFGYTVPADFGGAGASYGALAAVEEALAANGLGPLAVEISGQLTIGAGSLLAYGDGAQRRMFLPLVAEGRPMAFGLTEVGTGVNAKKIQAYVEEQPDGSYRLFAAGAANKLWITNAVHGGLIGIVARLGKGGKGIGLFIVELPAENVEAGAGRDYQFRCEPSGVAAFLANFNSRLHFVNFPIPKANQIGRAHV